MPRLRPRWWTELLLILVLYGAYSGARLLARGDIATAVDNGLTILRIEQALGMAAELPLNRLLTEHAWLGVPSSFVYAALHYLVTPALLIWLFRHRSPHYRLMRGWLLSSSVLALVGFALLPTCPPRLLDARHGFTDSLAQYSEYGWWAGEASAPSGLGDMTNQYAAMPSLHVGWSVWCAVVLWRYGSRSPLTRTLAVCYPLLITTMVLGTANHYLLDALAGVAVMGAGLLLVRPGLRLADLIRARLAPVRTGTRPVPEPAPVPEYIPRYVPGPALEPAELPRRLGEGKELARHTGLPHHR